MATAKAAVRTPDQPLAIRIMHWVHAACILLLIWSGFYIHYPASFAFPGAMNGARIVHFISMYVVVFNLIAKVYHAIVTGYYKTIWFYWRHFKDLGPLFAYYLWLRETEPKDGHLNPGQRLTYTMWLFLLIFEAVTGFGLYFYLPSARQFLGGMQWLRTFHFLGAWLFAITTLIHVYLGLYNGLHLFKGIITGYED
ncbi:MAG: cytochrome b/b6 domain-containing protein [Bacillota bacterium]|nr:cytochrome b/b6 domain-containing protein [Bacillota bacterium]